MTFRTHRVHKEYTKYGVPELVPYEGNVYCLTLERNHVMLVRRNDTISWCGNCFREYVGTLVEHEKKFIIWGSMNAVTYKEIFPLIKNNKIWSGFMMNKSCVFRVGDGCRYDEKLTAQKNDGFKYGRAPVSVFTNLDHAKRHKDLILWKTYTPEEYPKYDNYDAINVDRVADIPVDYYGVMGVPITFLDKYNPDQFEIVSFRKGDDGKDIAFTTERESGSSTVLSRPCSTAQWGLITGAKQTMCSDGRSRYARVAIRRRT